MWRRGTPAARSAVRGGVRHPGRAAQIDVVVTQVGDVGSEGGRRERVVAELARRPRDEREGALAARRVVQLLAEDDVGVVAGPIDEGHLARTGRQGLEQRPQRRDADTAADQQHLAPARSSGGDRPVRALGEHPCPRAQVGQRRLWSPSALTVMRSRSWRGPADSEYGDDAHHRPRQRNRHRKNWPDSARSSSRCRPPTTHAHTPRGLPAAPRGPAAGGGRPGGWA